MSRIGKKPIPIPDKTEIKIEKDVITVKGPKGELTQRIHPKVKAAFSADNKELLVNVENPKNKDERALWGLFGKLIANMIEGTTKGFEKKLKIAGVGYRGEVKGDTLILNVGFSHQVEFEFPKNIAIVVEKSIITVSGIDKQLIGEIAAQIRRIKKPEPYKGMGISYADEAIRRKAGKSAKAVGK